MSEKRKREDVPGGGKNKKATGPTVQNKPVIYAAPVAYKNVAPKPAPAPITVAPPPQMVVQQTTVAPTIPVFTDPAVYAAVAAASIPKRVAPPLTIDNSKKVVRYHRKAANQTWEDPTLSDWPEGL